MDGAGTTIFDRIEQKLSAAGAEIDIADLKEAVSQYDAKIASNPADTETRIIGLELKLVMLARLLNAAVEVLPQGGCNSAACAASAPETPFEEEGPAQAAPAQHTSSGPRKKRLRQNPATGVIEEIEDTAEDNVIVADGRVRFGKGGVPMKEEKKCVFISATDDENPGPSPVKKKG